MPLNQKALGLSAGIIAGACIFLTTLFALTRGYGIAGLNIYGSFHPGYTVSVAGAFIGLIYSFICWFVTGYVLAWLYNWFEKRFK